MERIRSLDRYQKIILLIFLAMALVFGVVYGVVTGREGYLYMDSVLVPTQAGSTTVYSGRIDGQKASFTVAADTVTFARGNRIYGPYLLEEDPTAVPEEDRLAQHMTGIVITDDGKPFFRGGMIADSNGLHLFREDGRMIYDITMTTGNGVSYDMDGNPIDPFEPSPQTIVTLLQGPELTHKGYWLAYLMGLLFSASGVVSILFADDLFRFRMSFRVQNADTIEPSDWEVSSRYIGWTILPILILYLYFVGLK